MGIFTDHPKSVGETYLQHLAMAMSFALRMFTGSLCCLLHALFPFLFVRTGSRIIAELHDRMVVNRQLKSQGGISPTVLQGQQAR